MPPVEGGAVENLLNFVLKYNETTNDVKFVIYSLDSKILEKQSKWKNSEFVYIKPSSFFKKIYGIFSRLTRKRLPNYYIKLILKDLKKRNINFDYVLIENMPIYVLYFKKLFKNKIILHVHNDWLNKSTLYSKEIIKSCRQIIAVSDFVKNKILEVDNQAKVKTVINGIDLKKFQIDLKKDKKKMLMEKYNINEEDTVFLYTGKLKPEKGTYELIYAFNKLSKNYTNIKLIMVGSSFNKYNRDTNYIKKIKKISINNENIIYTGFVDYEEINYLYKISDIQIVPSQCEDSCPLVVLEGLASGLALIVTNSGGIPELVNNNCAIQINRSESFISDLYNAMDSLVNNKNRINKMKKASISISKKYDKNIYAYKINNILMEK